VAGKIHYEGHSFEGFLGLNGTRFAGSHQGVSVNKLAIMEVFGGTYLFTSCFNLIKKT
jgi:hypothetical protein